MIQDFTDGKLDEIKAFAEMNNLLEAFSKGFSRFETYSERGFEVRLYEDWAPHSLAFSCFKDGKFDFNGGFIFHSPHDGFGDGGFASLSVSISCSRDSRWEIHT